MENQKTFAKNLSELRRRSGLSQRKAAADLKISQALLSHYENGAREPGLGFVCRVCDYYNVTADYLLGRSSNPKRQPFYSKSGLPPISGSTSARAQARNTIKSVLSNKTPSSKSLQKKTAGTRSTTTVALAGSVPNTPRKSAIRRHNHRRRPKPSSHTSVHQEKRGC